MNSDRNKEIGKRLKKAREEAGYMRANAAAEALGVKYPTYAAHENGLRGVVRSLDLYSRRYKVSLDWLLTGKGNMKIAGQENKKGEDKITNVPLIGWVSAGQMLEHEGVGDFSDFPTVAAYDLPRGKWIALRVDGLSMNKISPPDSIIFVNLQEIDLIPNACYVIADETGQATYKRYRPNEKPVFQPYSYQKIDPPKFEGTVRVIGRVRRTITDM